jgi:DNA-binding transcriptional MerR regulator
MAAWAVHERPRAGTVIPGCERDDGGKDMRNKTRYSIGDMSRICNISRKTLRYYEEIGLIASKRHDFNNYRYYTDDALLAIPVIKYYKQMGFTLEEMKAFIDGTSAGMYHAIQNSFRAKIRSLETEKEEIHRRCQSVRDWHDLIVEAEMVMDNAISEVSIKYVETAEYIYQEQTFENDIRASIINIAFTNFVEEQGNEVSGPVILHFSSHAARMEEDSQPIRILQKTLLPRAAEQTTSFGGCMMVTCYHIGPLETIQETYRKIMRWVQRHGYAVSGDAYERYVADYWTTRNAAQFVTEVMMKATRRGVAETGSLVSKKEPL